MLRGLLKKKRLGGAGGSDRFRIFIWWGARQEGVGPIFQGGTDILEGTMMYFWKLIYDNVEKKHSFHNEHIYIYWS